jgi:phenylalanine-4-hydroxylase
MATVRSPHLVELDPDHPGFQDSSYRLRRDSIASLAFAHGPGNEPPRVAYSPAEHAVWSQVLARLETLHARWAASAYRAAARDLALSRERIPQLAEVNALLRPRTRFRMDPVAGLVAARDFLVALAEDRFLSTQYVRHPSRPFYTPEPDVIHELVGHAATLADPVFAELNRAFGRAALRARSDRTLDRIDSLYWFSMEFGLVEEDGEPKVVGAGLLSSCGELERFESDARLLPFRAEDVIEADYDPTRFQETLYVFPTWKAFAPLVAGALERLA